MIIGSTANTGGIVVTADITASGFTTLELINRRGHHRPVGFTVDPMGTWPCRPRTDRSSDSADDHRRQQPGRAKHRPGGIFISNSDHGTLTIGFTSDPFQGVQDTGAAADAVSVTNAGTIDINLVSGE